MPVEGLLERVDLVLLGAQEVEESDDGSFELGTLLSADRDWGERFPQDDLTDVGGDEEGDTTANTVALLEEFVKKDDDDSGKRELEDDKGASDGSDLVDGAVHSGEEVSESLTHGDDD